MDRNKRDGKPILSLIVFFSFLWFFSPIHAATQKGSIQVNLHRISKEHEEIQLSLYDVTDFIEEIPYAYDALTTGKLSEEIIEQLEQEVKQRNLAAFTHTSDESQTIIWSELSRGVYLIVQQNAASYGMMESLLISLPIQSNDSEGEQMNLVIEPAVIQASTTQADTLTIGAAPAQAYIPTETITITDILLLLCVLSFLIIVLSIWRYQREQREL